MLAFLEHLLVPKSVLNLFKDHLMSPLNTFFRAAFVSGLRSFSQDGAKLPHHICSGHSALSFWKWPQAALDGGHPGQLPRASQRGLFCTEGRAGVKMAWACGMRWTPGLYKGFASCSVWRSEQRAPLCRWFLGPSRRCPCAWSPEFTAAED